MQIQAGYTLRNKTIIRAEPIMLKSLPIILSQNFDPLFLFYSLLILLYQWYNIRNIHMQNCYIGEQLG